MIITAPEPFVGIDIPQKQLDVAINPERQIFTCLNTEDGIQKLVSRLRKINPLSFF